MSSFEEAAPHFLRDLSTLLREAAMAARREKDTSRLEDRDFALGRLTAYHEGMSLLQQQVAAFVIDPVDLGIADLDPERDLV